MSCGHSRQTLTIGPKPMDSHITIPMTLVNFAQHPGKVIGKAGTTTLGQMPPGKPDIFSSAMETTLLHVPFCLPTLISILPQFGGR